MLIDIKPRWGSTVSNGIAWVELSSISPASLSTPKWCVLCHPPCQPHTQQYTGFFSSFSFDFWWNMPKFLCLKPLVFCQIGWNGSTGSKCAWGKIANWQMARQCSHICLISWRNRLKMLHYNRLQEERQRISGKKNRLDSQKLAIWYPTLLLHGPSPSAGSASCFAHPLELHVFTELADSSPKHWRVKSLCLVLTRFPTMLEFVSRSCK